MGGILLQSSSLNSLNSPLLTHFLLCVCAWVELKPQSHVNKHKDRNMVKMLFMVYITPKNKSKQPNPKHSLRGGSE